MKVKAIPIKSETLCEKCFYDVYCDTHSCGSECPMYNKRKKDDETWHCKCLNLANGEPCRYFKRKENTFPKITTHGFFVDKCKCGGNVAIQFGFSCTGKPMSALSCDNCKKTVHVIGNLKHGQKFMDIWEGADDV